MDPTRSAPMSPTETFRAARDFLVHHREDYETARRDFRWPVFADFNWALDWFDVIAADNPHPALRVIDDDGEETVYSFAELADRSNRIAAWLRHCGVRRGDRTLLMVGNQPALWECVLSLMKLGAVIIPSTTLLTEADINDRIRRARVSHVVAESSLADHFTGLAGVTRIAVGETVSGWLTYTDWTSWHEPFRVDGRTDASDPLFLYFTSGTTALPKMVEHTHASYPVGHLSTMYWLGVQPGDVQLNISSPGWAKHAWSSIFAPWNAEATILVLNAARFSATQVLDALERYDVTTFCAPPTVWRMLIQEDLAAWRPRLREAVSAGEPLNPEVIEQIRRAWGLTIRDGYGQTETTAQIGNPPRMPLLVGSMGKPLPGYVIDLVDPATGAVGDQGEICIDLSRRPVGLMTGYRDDDGRTAEVMRDGHYHTGDVASRDSAGNITYIGRTDDVFKSSDYRISPFELESVLIEHSAVAEAAVVPSPDPLRLAVPKAFIALSVGQEPSRELALSIFRYAHQRLAGYKRIRRLEFADLPKTISGKIRRVDLRAREAASQESRLRGEHEYWEQDFDEFGRR